MMFDEHTKPLSSPKCANPIKPFLITNGSERWSFDLWNGLKKKKSLTSIAKRKLNLFWPRNEKNSPNCKNVASWKMIHAKQKRLIRVAYKRKKKWNDSVKPCTFAKIMRLAMPSRRDTKRK